MVLYYMQENASPQQSLVKVVNTKVYVLQKDICTSTQADVWKRALNDPFRTACM